MKKFLAGVMVVGTLLHGAEFDPDEVRLSAKTDQSALSYAPGEEMVYTVKADLKGQSGENLRILWFREGDDGKISEGRLPADRESSVKTSLDRPGFVRMDFILADKEGKPLRQRCGKNKTESRVVAFYAGSAVEPETLEDCGEPADFDAFWAKQKARLAKVPFRGKTDIREVKKYRNGTVYAISIPCAGPRPATGYLTVPSGAAEKSLPIYLYFSGYGPRIADPPYSVAPGKLELYVNAHGQKLMQSKEYYEKFFSSIRSEKYSYAFDPEENKDPETAYFNGMVLRALRALEYLKTRPEWDGKNIVVQGGSQGGLQTMWVTALDPGVTEAYPVVTWCCDMAGQSKKKRNFGSWKIPYVPALDYYDPVFMAKRIKTAKVEILRAGLGDYTCPPSGLAVCYNNLATPHKSIRWVQGSNHAFVPQESEVIVWKNSSTRKIK